MNRLSSFALLACAALACSAPGCARLTPLGPDLAARLAYDQAARERYKLDQDWWKVYGDEALNLTIETALKNNPDLAKAALSVNRALYQAGLLDADLTPAFSGSLSASERSNLKTGGPAERSISGQVRLTYELDLWRRLSGAASAARWEYQATIEDREAARLTLINKVVDAYYRLAYLNDALEADAGEVKNLRAVAEAARARYQAGKSTALEPAQAEQAVLNAENALLSRQSQFHDVFRTLKNLLNSQDPRPLAEGPTLRHMVPPEPDLNIPLSVLANRPDLKAAEFRLHRALANAEAAERAWLPAISLETALSAAGVTSGQAFSQPVGSAGFSISLPFLDWAKVAGAVRIAETDYETAKLNFEAALTAALNEVAVCYNNYAIAKASLANARRKHAQDLKISEYQRARYQAGGAELSDWLNSVNAANASRLAALNALYQLLAADAQTWQALGGRYIAGQV